MNHNYIFTRFLENRLLVPHSTFILHVAFNFQIFEMMDAKARQDCKKEIDLLKVS